MRRILIYLQRPDKLGPGVWLQRWVGQHISLTQILEYRH